MNTEPHSVKRLYKSARNKIVSGVCGGIAEYFEIDPTIVRIVWIVSTFLGGVGLILYICAVIVIPASPPNLMKSSFQQDSQRRQEPYKCFGIVLVLIGVIVLMNNLDILTPFDWWIISWKFVLPIVFIMFGCWLIYLNIQQRKVPGTETTPTSHETKLEQPRQ